MAKEQWRDYWRNASQIRPQEDISCIVLLPHNSLRMARYVKDDDVFYTYKKGDVKYKDVLRWIPVPITLPEASMATNIDVPIECIYAHLYGSYKAKCDEIKRLKKYIRKIHDMVANECTAKDIVDVLRNYENSRVTMDKLEYILESINA